MKISLTLPDDRIPRTQYHACLLDALRRNPRFADNPHDANVLFPAEDTAFETHWPRYGDTRSVYLRGQPDHELYKDYLGRLGDEAQQHPNRNFCIVGNHPWYRLAQCFKHLPNVFIADANLHALERVMNPRTIAWPALPMVTPLPDQGGREGAQGGRDIADRQVLASFRGAISHPVREQLLNLHDGRRFICEAADRSRIHVDATRGQSDPRYVELLERSIFAFVPRGDSLFSYRFLEVLSFGCIPIVLSDGWVLPFDRLIHWNTVAVIMPESTVSMIPRALELFPPERIRQMQASIHDLYQDRFCDLDHIVESLMQVLEPLLAAS